MTSINYNTFKLRLAALQNWDSDTQLMQGDLALKAKPKLNLWHIIKLRFSHEQANNAVAAAKNLSAWTSQFQNELKKDKDTLSKVQEVNSKIFHTFVTGSEKNHILRSRSRRNSIHNAFYSTKGKCKDKEQSKDFPPLKITKASDIDKFLKKFNPDTPEEAVFYFKELRRHVYRLDREQANRILIKIRQIKKSSSKSETPESFIKTNKKLRNEIRGKVFAERLAQNRDDLEALLNNFKGSESGKVYRILEKWTNSLEKNQPIDIPKWFHCTKADYINGIITSNKIEVRHQGAYKGAFASTVPESVYGNYCIALGSNIEAQARKLPKLTRVGYGPIYIGAKPPLKNNPLSITPSIWAGFKEDISLKKPKKSKDPLAYYSHTNFVLLGSTAPFDGKKWGMKDPWKAGLNEEIRADLKKRKIDLLSNDDFEELVQLVNQTFHCHLPYSWRNIRYPFIRKLGCRKNVIVKK